MNDKPSPVLNPEDDPALATLIADLRAVHAAPLPAPLRASIRRGIQQQMHMPSAPRARGAGADTLIEGDGTGQRARHRTPRPWPALIAAVLVVVCLALLATLARQIGGAVPAAKPTPTVPATTAGYSSTVCGFRLTVTRAYADANRVIVGYSIAPPAGRSFLNGLDGMTTLRTAQGAELRGGPGGGSEMIGDAGNRFSPLGRARGDEQVAAFESNGEIVPGQGATLVLSISDLQTTEFAGSRPVTRACERYGASGGGLRQVTVPGPVSVRFTVPVQATIRQAALHWVIGRGQEQETVDRIVVTPTETRIYVRGSAIYPPQIEISGVRPYHGPDGNGWRQGAEKVFVYNNYASYFHSLYQKPNPWTLVVLSGSTPSTYGVGPPFATLRINLS